MVENNEYNDIPVIYCRDCLSLDVRNFIPPSETEQVEGVLDDADFCYTCGSTNLAVATIKEYIELFNKKYGHNPWEKKKKYDFSKFKRERRWW